MKITKKVVTTTTATITIEDIIKAFDLPPHAKVNFHVPGGGDYSNMTLSIAEHPLTAEWKE